jgi:two-component system, sensor histidine kinase PdtaS
MAQVHEELYESQDYTRVDMNEYLAKLSRELLAAYNSEEKVSLCLKADGVALDVSLSIPCGLILNELITNAFKYAFPGDRTGEIAVLFRKAEDGQYELSVSDDGVGIAKEGDNRHGDSLGLTLVNLLTRQLGGTISVATDRGTSYRIRFPARGEP